MQKTRPQSVRTESGVRPVGRFGRYVYRVTTPVLSQTRHGHSISASSSLVMTRTHSPLHRGQGRGTSSGGNRGVAGSTGGGSR